MLYWAAVFRAPGGSVQFIFVRLRQRMHKCRGNLQVDLKKVRIHINKRTKLTKNASTETEAQRYE